MKKIRKYVSIILSFSLIVSLFSIGLTAYANEGPKDQVEATIDQVEGPTDQAEGPTDQVEGPTDQAEGPTDQVDGPTDQAEGPTDQAEGPTDQVEDPTDQAEGPTDQVDAPVDKAEATPDQVDGPTNRAAGNDISDWAVTKLSVKNSQITDGRDVEINLEFKENQPDRQNKIHGGDTIKISWNRLESVYISAYKRNIPLDFKGHIIANAVIENDSAVITFNDVVNNLHNVEGYLTFSAFGRNLSTEDGYHEGKIKLQSGNKTAEVTVSINNKKDEGDDVLPFYYKSGMMSPDKEEAIDWDLCINNNGSAVQSDIILQDNIQDGHELDKDSFYISVTGADQTSKRFEGPDAIQKFREAYPNADISITKDLKNFTVTIPQVYASKAKIRIRYSTKILDPTKAKYTNKSEIRYQEVGKDAMKEPYDASVDSVNSGGGIKGTVRGEFRLYKTITNTKIPVEGAKFELWEKSGQEIRPGEKKIILITKADGIADIKELPVGEYSVKEVGAPEHIDFVPIEDPIMDFEVKLTDTSGTECFVENNPSPKYGFLTVKKTVSGDGADKNQPFTFTVTLDSEEINGTFDGKTIKNGKETPEQTTFQNGKVTFKLKDGESKTIQGLPVGLGYTVTESNNDGYKVTVDNEDKSVAKGILGMDKTVVNFNNKKEGTPPKAASVTLTAEKTMDNGEPKDGAFTFLLKKEGDDSGEEKTNIGKKIEFTSLTFDKEGDYIYYISEKVGTDSQIDYDKSVYKVIIKVSDDYKASVSYLKDGAEYKGIPTFANKTKQKAETISVSVDKVWDDNNYQNRPTSVKVQLYKNGTEEGNAVILNDANQWKHTWKELDKSAEWKVKEIDVPDGYSSKIEENGTNFTITNTYVPDKPTNPTEPENPSTPSKPDKPTNPTEPKNPSTPSKPDKPTNPTEPKNPSTLSKPKKPSNSTEPKEPIKKLKVIKPKGQDKPSELEKPKEAIKKSEETQPKESTATETNNTVPNQSSKVNIPDRVPQTGDNSMMNWMALMILSGAGLFAVDIYNKKHR